MELVSSTVKKSIIQIIEANDLNYYLESIIKVELEEYSAGQLYKRLIALKRDVYLHTNYSINKILNTRLKRCTEDIMSLYNNTHNK